MAPPNAVRSSRMGANAKYAREERKNELVLSLVADLLANCAVVNLATSADHDHRDLSILTAAPPPL